MKQGVLFTEIAHEELFHLQAAGIPPGKTNEKGIGASASGEPGGFRVEEEPLGWIFERGTCAPGKRFIASSREKLQRKRQGRNEFWRGKPISDGEVFAVTILDHAGTDELREGIPSFGR